MNVNDIENLSLLYVDKEGRVEYLKAISNLIPVLSKNSDKIGGSNFKIGWSLSQNAKQRAAFAKKQKIKEELNVKDLKSKITRKIN